MAVYISERGARRLAQELRVLTTETRPKVVQEVADAAAQGDRSENAEYIYGKKRLREIDRRIRFLTKRLDQLVVVGPQQRPDERDRVFFGAWVTIEDEEARRKRYRLLGPDEADPARGELSYQSPLGAVLMRRRIGDVVELQRPAGAIELSILEISYEEQEVAP